MPNDLNWVIDSETAFACLPILQINIQAGNISCLIFAATPAVNLLSSRHQWTKSRKIGRIVKFVSASAHQARQSCTCSYDIENLLSFTIFHEVPTPRVIHQNTATPTESLQEQVQIYPEKNAAWTDPKHRSSPVRDSHQGVTSVENWVWVFGVLWRVEEDVLEMRCGKSRNLDLGCSPRVEEKKLGQKTKYCPFSGRHTQNGSWASQKRQYQWTGQQQ